MDPRGLTILVLIATLVHLGPEHGSRHASAATTDRRVEHVCQDLDIRNSVEAFDKLVNCTVVEGFLRILLIDYAKVSDYKDLSFPALREVTGYVLLYRVYGLQTLSNIFPSLSVIRGQHLFYNYALVVFEMPDFEELGLHSLTRIVRGAIRLEKNPSLCYVDTIDYMRIASTESEDNYIVQNKGVGECVNVCPRINGGHCPIMEVPMGNGLKRSQPLCWNSQHCQKVCPDQCGLRPCYEVNSEVRCCHAHCLGGCRGPDVTDCDACVHVFYKGRCLNKCPQHTYELMERRCILEEECRNISNKKFPWKLLDNKCVLGCPTGYMTSTADDHMCIKCAGKCPKVCSGMVIENVAAAQKLKGCVVIKGILEIQIRGGSHVARELEENLGMIEVVTHYVRIVRSYALVSLRFLKSLRVIRGEQLHNYLYALALMDNKNVQEIWDVAEHPNLTIENGKVSFHHNPKLCIGLIHTFVHSVGLQSVTDGKDVDAKSNGDQVPCDVTKIKLEVHSVMAEFAYIIWDNFHPNDQRELLNWVVNYREAPEQNVTLFNARDACGSDVWKTNDVGPGNSKSMATILIHLRPYTQYALYVQTYTIATAKTGAMSDIVYFTTKPGLPTHARDISVVARIRGELHVTWKSPSKMNGNVTHYYVYWQPQVIHAAKFDKRDYCLDKLRMRAKKQKIIVKEETTDKNLPYDAKCCSCPKSKKELRVEEEERQFEIKFENFLHDTVYIKREDIIDVVDILSQTSNASDSEEGSTMKKKNKNRKKSRTTLEDLTRQMGTSKKQSSLSDLLPRNHSYSSVLDNYELTINRTRGSVNDTVDEADEQPPYEVAVVYGKTEAILPNLRHFQEYSIEVIACHEYQEGMDEKLCSNRAVTTARTMPDRTADTIDKANITVANLTDHSVWIRWVDPISPNGLILTYEIELTKVDESHFKPAVYCIAHVVFRRDAGYRTDTLNPGNWSFRIRATSLAGNGSWTDSRHFYVAPIVVPVAMNMQLMIGIIVGVCLFLAIIIPTTVFIIIKHGRIILSPEAVISVNPDYWSEVYEPDEWEVPRADIKLLCELGQGSFGMVYEGTARNMKDKAVLIKVAIKTVNDNATANDRIQFLKEASVMKAFNCNHVVKLLGVVSLGQPTLVIMELMSHGDLKRFLQVHRPDLEDNDRRPPLQVSQILQWAGDIADGMAYLSFSKFVHRDLAARNCMVSENEVVKIGDFGMTRDIYETDYYRKGGKGLLPVRWMAPESLRDGKFDRQSDVWSYGVVLWEMVTLAEQPYQGLSNEEVLHFVIDGHVMEEPVGCPDKIFKLMAMCWQFRPRNRPTFEQIIETLNPDLSDAFRETSYFYNESNHKYAAPVSDGEDDALTDDAKTPLTGTPHCVGTPMASSLQHHSYSTHGGSTSSHLLPDLDYRNDSVASGSSESGRSMLDRSHSPPPTCIHDNPCECVPLTRLGGGAARTSRIGDYWKAPVEPPYRYYDRGDANSAIHSIGDATDSHKSRTNDASSRKRNGLANGHIPMAYLPSGANRV